MQKYSTCRSKAIIRATLKYQTERLHSVLKYYKDSFIIAFLGEKRKDSNSTSLKIINDTQKSVFST